MVQRGFTLQWVWAVWRWLKKETFFSLLGWMNCQRQGSDGAVEKLCFLQQATNLFQFTPNKGLLNAKVTLWVTWISSALDTYLSRWFINGMRKCFLPTTLLQGFFPSDVWHFCYHGFVRVAVLLEQHHLTPVGCHRRASKGKEDYHLLAIPLVNTSLSLKLSWMGL